MAETTTYYDSTLTGEELDTAFGKLVTLDDSVAAAQAAQQTAADHAQVAEAWARQAQTVAQGALGWYADADALRAVNPTGQNGQWALIGDTDTIWTWDADTAAWINTATRIDLSNYYTKAQTDAAVTAVKQQASTNAAAMADAKARLAGMQFMAPGLPTTTQFFSAMGNGGNTAVMTWEKATDGNLYLVARVNGTVVFAIRGFSGFNFIQ